MRKITLTIGLIKNAAGNYEEISRASAIEVINNIYWNNNIDSYTVIDCTGYWKGEKEESLQVIAVNDSFPVTSICEDLKNALSQDCIAAEITNVDFYLI